MDDLPIPRWAVNILMVVFAIFGGMVGHAMRENDKGNKIEMRGMMLEGLGSGFVGILVLFLCTEMGISLPYTGFTVGILSWVGAISAFRLLSRFLPERLTPPPANKDNEI